MFFTLNFLSVSHDEPQIESLCPLRAIRWLSVDPNGVRDRSNEWVEAALWQATQGILADAANGKELWTPNEIDAMIREANTDA